MKHLDSMDSTNPELKGNLVVSQQTSSVRIARIKVSDRELLFAVADERDHIQRRLLSGELYEFEMLNDIRERCVPGDGIAVDVGANIGTHTIFLAAVCGMRVVAFEPQEAARRLLIESITLNAVKEQVTVLSTALGEEPSRGRLQQTGHSSGMTRIEVNSSLPEPSSESAVDIVPLDHVDLPGPVRLLKIDVEGMECAVLRGAAEILRRDRPLIYCETASHLAFQRVSTLLHEMGYWPAARFNYTPTVLFQAGPLPDDQIWSAVTQAYALQLHSEQELRREISRLRTLVEHHVNETGRLMRLADPALLVGAEALVVHYLRQAVQRPWPEAAWLPLRITALATAVGLRRLHRRRWLNPPLARSPRNGPLGERISVVMTSFNSAGYIERAIESILRQSYENLELIVVDDASEDETFTLIERMAQRDDRVIPVQGLTNRGTYYCKNLGIVMARGAVIATHDSDDAAEPEWLALHMAHMRQDPRALVVTSDYVRVDDAGQIVPNRGLVVRPALQSQTYRRTVFERAGYFDSVRVSADQEFRSRLEVIFGRRSIRHLPRVLYRAQVRQGSLTDQHPVHFDVLPNGGRDFLSPVRRHYFEAYRNWQMSSSRRRLFVGFPLPNRCWQADPSILPERASRNDRLVAAVVVRDRSEAKAVARSLSHMVDKLILLVAGAVFGLAWGIGFVSRRATEIEILSVAPDDGLVAALSAAADENGVIAVLGLDVRKHLAAIQWSLLKLDQYGSIAVAGDGWRAEAGRPRYILAGRDQLDRAIACPGGTLLVFRTATIATGALAAAGASAECRGEVLAKAGMPIIVPGVDLGIENLHGPDEGLGIPPMRMQTLAAQGEAALRARLDSLSRFSQGALRSRQIEPSVLLPCDGAGHAQR